MTHRGTARWVVLALWSVAILLSGMPAAEANNEESQWLATGIVTRVTPDQMFLLAKDNVIYRISTSGANVLINDQPGSLSDIGVGDKVRVYGKKTGPKDVKGIQMKLISQAPRAPVTAPEPEQPAAPVQEKTPPPVPAPAPEQPKPVVPEEPSAGRGPAAGPSFMARGLINDMHLTEGWVTILTNEGLISVDVGDALVQFRGKPSSVAELSVGDAVNIIGERVSTGRVQAVRVDILAEKATYNTQTPALAVSSIGLIKNVDYSSFTFAMDSPAGMVLVMVDGKTRLQGPGGKDIGFSDIKPGMRVKVSGLGSLTTGYLAQYVVVVGAPR